MPNLDRLRQDADVVVHVSVHEVLGIGELHSRGPQKYIPSGRVREEQRIPGDIVQLVAKRLRKTSRPSETVDLHPTPDRGGGKIRWFYRRRGILVIDVAWRSTRGGGPCGSATEGTRQHQAKKADESHGKIILRLTSNQTQSMPKNGLGSSG